MDVGPQRVLVGGYGGKDGFTLKCVTETRKITFHINLLCTNANTFCHEFHNCVNAV